jgi:hypothetical protein
VATLAAVTTACASPRHQRAAEMLERAELRDAWLSTLIPIGVAGLLLLFLVVSWQRRRGSTFLDGLFRPRGIPDIRRGLRDAVGTYNRWQAERRERERANLRAAEEATGRVNALAAARAEALAACRIVSPDGQTILQAHQRVRIRTRHGESSGSIVDITDAGLTLSAWAPRKGPGIPWADVRDISVRVGRERRREIPLTVGALGGLLLGAVGWLVDALNQSTSGRESNAATGWGVVLGALIGGVLGMIIMAALPGARWRKLVDVAPGSPPLSLPTFAARVAETAAAAAGTADTEWDTEDTIETAARGILIILVLMIVVMCSG